MVKITVLYGPPADPAAFEAHYANIHMPLVAKAGLPKVEAGRVVGTPTGEPPPYYRMFTARFDTQADLERALGTAEGQAVAADVANFATGGATIFISQVD
jgi:uncharacterized protein (TIGR02118 family)